MTNKSIDYRQLIEQLSEQTNQNYELARTIFNQLFDEVPTQLNQIQLAILKKDFDTAETVTHTLHGSLRFCGFVVFQEAVRLLEIALKQQDIMSIQRNFRALKQKLDAFLQSQDEIKDYFERKLSK